jgi:hypothetical protein
MNIKILFFSLITLFVLTNEVYAQEENNNLVQFSGMVLDGTTDELLPVPYANILVMGKGRGTYSEFSGFFSLVVEKGDTVRFSAIGYKTADYFVSDTLTDNRYSLVQLLTRDDVNLPEAVVFPWPSREHFKLEFLAMDVSSEMQERASANVAEDALARMRNEVRADGNENADYYLRQQARKNYYIGQTPPMNIFSPIARKQFFDTWKAGGFKKEKTKK